MKKFLVLVVLILLLFSLISFSEEGRNVVVKQGEIKVDGTLEEQWNNAVWYEFNEDTANAEDGDFSTFNGKFALLYNNNTLYLAFSAEDELFNATRDHNVWQDDCIEVWLDWTGKHLPAYSEGYYQICIAPTTDDSFFPDPKAFIFRTEGEIDGYIAQQAVRGMKIAATSERESWILEVEMDLSKFISAIVDGKVTGNGLFNISINDRDMDGGEKSHLTWNGSDHKNSEYFVPIVFE